MRDKLPVACYEPNGKFVESFGSLRDASEEWHTRPSAISKAIRFGIQHRNLYWVVVEGKPKKKITPRIYRADGKQVVVKTVRGKEIYCRAISEAVKLTGIAHSTIRNHIHSKKRHIKGYLFAFVNEEDYYRKTVPYGKYKELYKNIRPNRTVPVRLINQETGKARRFASIQSASEILKVNRCSILSVLAGRWKTAGGYLVERI